MVGSHGHGLVRDLLYGQTVDKVRHRLDIPMLIARPDRSLAALEPGTPIPPAALDESVIRPPRVEPRT